MKTLDEIKEKIYEIKYNVFKITEIEHYDKKYKVCNLLRKALICVNDIDVANVSTEQKLELYKKLDEVMKNKINMLNPNLNSETLNKMIEIYKQGYAIYPMDILVVDDAVFYQEGVISDFGEIYKIKTIMLDNMKPYYNISSTYFNSVEFDFFSPHTLLTREDNIYTSKFISDHINSIYNGNITKPMYEFNTDIGYEDKEIFCNGINIYINMKFDEIGRSLKEKKECDIKLCFQNKDDITLYYIHQSFKDNKPFWNIVKTNSEVWRLTDEILRLKNDFFEKHTLRTKDIRLFHIEKLDGTNPQVIIGYPTIFDTKIMNMETLQLENYEGFRIVQESCEFSPNYVYLSEILDYLNKKKNIIKAMPTIETKVSLAEDEENLKEVETSEKEIITTRLLSNIKKVLKKLKNKKNYHSKQ